MADQRETVRTTTEASGGSRGRQVSTVLAVSLVLIVVAFVAAYIAYFR